MEFLNDTTNLIILCVLIFLVSTVIVALFFRGAKNGVKDIELDMLKMREKTKDIELPEDDPMRVKGGAKVEGPMLKSGGAKVEGPSQEDIDADQPSKPKKSSKKTRKKVKRKSLAEKILTYMQKHEGEAIKAAQVTKYFRQFSNQHVYSSLNKLVKDKKIKKAGRGLYKLEEK